MLRPDLWMVVVLGLLSAWSIQATAEAKAVEFRVISVVGESNMSTIKRRHSY
jgi:hypothetical protein